MSLEQWAQLIQSTGLGGLVAFLIYKLIRAFGSWFSTAVMPQVFKITEGHSTLVEALTKSVEEDVIGHRTTHGYLDKHGGKLDEIHGVVKKLKPPSDFTGDWNTNKPKQP